MVVLSEIRFESLQLTVQKLTVSGLTPNRENFAIEESFSDLDFNVIQCFFYQMYMRYAKKNVPPYDDGTMMSWVHQMNTGDSKLRDVAIRCGYSLYKVAKCYLFSIHHTGMIAFMEEPDLFPNVEKR